MKTFKEFIGEGFMAAHVNRAVHKKTGEQKYFRWSGGTGHRENIKSHKQPNGHVYMTSTGDHDVEFADGTKMSSAEFGKHWHQRSL